MANSVSERTPLIQHTEVEDSFESLERIYICKVCSKRDTIPNNFNGRVVKCNNCGEGTPISLPPPGKKYVRCVCHCLLLCSVRSTFLRCPRKTCQRVVEVSSPDSALPVLSHNPEHRQGGRKRPQSYLCPHCKHLFDWPSGRVTADCTFCHKACVTDPKHARRRAFIWFALTIVFILATGGVVAGTFKFEKENTYIVAAWAACGVVCLLSTIRGALHWKLSGHIAKPLSS